MMIIRAAGLDESESVQSIFNSRDIIGYLGGFTRLETIVSKIKQSGNTCWIAETYESEIVGAMLIAGRNQCHFAKFGEVGVLPEYRRRRICTSLYSAIVFQGILEGRRIWEDTIVGTNPYQFMILPTLNINEWGTLKKKTASFLDIHIFGLLLNEDIIRHLLSRIPDDYRIALTLDYYTSDLWNKNMDVYKKKCSGFLRIIQYCRDIIENDNRIVIEKGLMKPPHNIGKKRFNPHQEQLI